MGYSDVKSKGIESIIEQRLKDVLKKYENDKKMRAAILDEVGLYRLNLTIAQKHRDKKTIKRLNKEIIHYLEHLLRKN